MKVIGKDRTSCDVCNPIDEILARLDALERRASAIVAKVQGIAPDGEGNVTLPTSSSDTDPLHGRIDAFAMSSEVKEAADDAHAYAASIADDVVVLQQNVNQLSNTVAGYGDRLNTAESKNDQQDTAIGALQTADGQNVKLTGEHAIGNYAVLLTGNQDKSGNLNMLSRTDYPNRNIDIFNPPTYSPRGISEVKTGPADANTAMREEFTFATGGNTLAFTVHCGDADGVTDHTATLMFTVFRDGKARLQLKRESGTVQIVPQG